MSAGIRHFHENPPQASWASLLRRPSAMEEENAEVVREILEAVRNDGDKAVRHYSARFDGYSGVELEISAADLAAAENQLEPELAEAIRTASRHITHFHQPRQDEEEPLEVQAGVRCWRRSVPIEKVGIYVPGGTAPLFSSVLMLAIPARLAGCPEIILCTPPQSNGSIHPAILFAAQLTGVTRVFRLGGAQAIAAMAFGTETIPAVYKICGPGNRFVTEAKQQVTRFGIAIDMPAGPSEVLVWSDHGANPEFVAADLLSQAEHGEDSQVVLVCPDRDVFDAVNRELIQQVDLLPRRDKALVALEHSFAVAMSDQGQALDLINAYAPEHLILALRDPHAAALGIRNAGSVFLGDYSPEAAGDYASGTNHTLPTHGYARAYSGVSTETFLKKITFQEISPEGLEILGPVVATMAAAEALEGHRQAVIRRLSSQATAPEMRVP